MQKYEKQQYAFGRKYLREFRIEAEDYKTFG